MKSLAVIALFALCAIAFADDAPEVLFPCAFSWTMSVSIRNTEGEELATTMNEISHDNGDYWIWKSEFTGNDFVHSFVDDHQWSIIWRPDTGYAYRHDLMARKCYKSTFANQPTPYNWIQSKTYGIMWFDELIDWNGKAATLYTAVGVGNYASMDFETEANFYVLNNEKQLVHFNGTLTAHQRDIKLVFESKSLSFTHNSMIPPKTFAVNAPCEQVASPAEPSEDFKTKCYQKSGASSLAISSLAVLIAIIAAFLSF